MAVGAGVLAAPFLAAMLAPGDTCFDKQAAGRDGAAADVTVCYRAVDDFDAVVGEVEGRPSWPEDWRADAAAPALR